MKPQDLTKFDKLVLPHEMAALKEKRKSHEDNEFIEQQANLEVSRKSDLSKQSIKGQHPRQSKDNIPELPIIPPVTDLLLPSPITSTPINYHGN